MQKNFRSQLFQWGRYNFFTTSIICISDLTAATIFIPRYPESKIIHAKHARIIYFSRHLCN